MRRNSGNRARPRLQIAQCVVHCRALQLCDLGRPRRGTFPCADGRAGGDEGVVRRPRQRCKLSWDQGESGDQGWGATPGCAWAPPGVRVGAGGAGALLACRGRARAPWAQPRSESRPPEQPAPPAGGEPRLQRRRAGLQGSAFSLQARVKNSWRWRRKSGPCSALPWAPRFYSSVKPSCQVSGGG